MLNSPSIRAVLPVLALLLAIGTPTSFAETVEFAGPPPRELEPVAVEPQASGLVGTHAGFTATLPVWSDAAPIRVIVEGHAALEMRTTALSARNANGTVVWRDQARNTMGQVDGNVVCYAGRFSVADDVYAMFDTQLKHDAVLHERPVAPGAVWLGLDSELALPTGYTAQPDWFASDPSQGVAHAIWVYAPDETLAYVLPELFATDANGKRIDGRYRVLSVTSTQVRVVAEFPMPWLNEAAYPVRLDPTLTYDSGSTVSRDGPFEKVGLGAQPAIANLMWWSPPLYQSASPPAGYIRSISFQAAGAGTFTFERMKIEIRESNMEYSTNWTTSFTTALNLGSPTIVAYDAPFTYHSTAPGDWVTINFDEAYQHSGSNGVAMVVRLLNGSGSGNGRIRYSSSVVPYNQGADLNSTNFNATSAGGSIGLTQHARFEVDNWYVSSPPGSTWNMGDVYVGDTINFPFDVSPSTTVTYTPPTTLPPGISWNTSTNTLEGTVDVATANTTVAVDVVVSDGGGTNITVPLRWNAYDYPVATLGDQIAVTGAPFVATPQLTGGKAPVTWTAVVLPSWATFDTTTGEITGTPTASDLGMTVCSINAVDANGINSGVIFDLEVRDPVAVTTTSLPTATEDGTSYSAAIEVTGGSGALAFSAIGLPPTMSIDPNTGVISGDPVAGDAANSPYTVDVTVIDTVVGGAPINVTLSLDVVPAPTITTTSFPNGSPGNMYFAPVEFEDGVAPFTVLVNGLPTTLTYVDLIDGIFGTPDATEIGVHPITIEVIDANGASTVSNPIDLRISSPVASKSSSCAAGHGSWLSALPMLAAFALLVLVRRRIAIVA